MWTRVVLGLVGLIAPVIALAPDSQTPGSQQLEQSRSHEASQTPAIRAAPVAEGDGGGAGGPAGSPVPEPYTLALVGSGLLALAFVSRRRNARSAE